MQSISSSTVCTLLLVVYHVSDAIEYFNVINILIVLLYEIYSTKTYYIHG